MNDVLLSATNNENTHRFGCFLFIPEYNSDRTLIEYNGGGDMNSCELTMAVTAVANTIAAKLNSPEEIAAGVGFGSGDISQALIIAGGIALQNIPEGMVIIAPMLSAGIKPAKTFLFASVTGLIEVIGTLIGYFAVSVSTVILPFALSFAGGTMLYIISDEMIPETHAHGNERPATYALLIGFCVMLITDTMFG